MSLKSSVLPSCSLDACFRKNILWRGSISSYPIRELHRFVFTHRPRLYGDQNRAYKLLTSFWTFPFHFQPQLLVDGKWGPISTRIRMEIGLKLKFNKFKMKYRHLVALWALIAAVVAVFNRTKESPRANRNPLVPNQDSRMGLMNTPAREAENFALLYNVQANTYPVLLHTKKTDPCDKRLPRT